MNLDQLADAVHPVVLQARDAIVAVYHSGHMGATHKADNTPVTDADRASHDILVAGLAQRFPDIPVISEESRGADLTAGGSYFWLVDPLDGTKEFIRGTGEFTVNVALVDPSGIPIWGLVDVPMQQKSYIGYQQRAFVRTRSGDAVLDRLASIPPSHPRAVALSRSHQGTVDEWLQTHHIPVDRVVYAGSAVKFCWIADGAVDLYVRLLPTMGWDTAAGQALVEAVGGSVRSLQDERLSYRPYAQVNPSFRAERPLQSRE